VKKWWGNHEMWIDMLATEIAKILGDKVGLEDTLGQSWKTAADDWLDSTYATATKGMQTPPNRRVLVARAATLGSQVFSRVHQNGSGDYQRQHPFAGAVKVEKTTCDACGLAYAKRLDSCPSCKPAVSSSSRPSSGERSDPESKRKDWRKSARSPLENVAWAEVSDCLWCHGGSGGVVLIETLSGVVCAKKCSAEELFAQRLASRMGVQVANMRVLSPGDAEGKALRQGVRAVAPCTSENDGIPVRKVLQSTFLSVVDFVDGFGMMGMDAHNHLREQAAHEPVWYELGRLMGFDMLVNNFDRLPLAWTNEGNLGNVMVGSSVKAVVGIDQACAPITHPDGLTMYTKRVQKAVDEARNGASQRFEAVKTAIYNNTAVELTDDHVQSLRKGCLDFVLEAIRRSDAGEFEQILEEVSSEVVATFTVANPVDLGTGSPRSVQKLVDSCCDLARAVMVAIKTDTPSTA